MKKVTIPFDLKLAKDIQEGRVEGRVIDRDGEQYTILKYDAPGKCPLVCICPSPMTSDLTIARTYTTRGEYYHDKDECPYDLVLEVPEYVTWKEGDYLTIIHNSIEYIIIFKDFDTRSGMIDYHALYRMDIDFLDINNNTSKYDDVTPSTPEDIQVITDALSYGMKRWNPDTKRVEDLKKEPEHEFKPFDRVLVRDDDRDYWRPEFFSYKDEEGNTCCCGGVRWTTAIPYEGNEHLTMTTITPKEC